MYTPPTAAELSWTQADPHLSLSLIAEISPSGSVIDVGGGTSLLAGKLLDHGYSVAVLDISEAAVTRGQERLGPTVTPAGGTLRRIGATHSRVD
jgi:hypothetical protein